MKLSLSFALVLISTASCGFAVTVANFNGGPGDTVWQGDQNGAAPGPVVVAGIGPDGTPALELNLDGANDQNNTVGFDRGDIGPQNVVPYSFDFRVGPPPASADGFSFSFLPTSIYGTSGQVPFLSEDPMASGVLAFGFDTWGNDPPTNDTGVNVNDRSNYNDISLYFNNVSVAANFDPRSQGLTIDDDIWHRAFGTIDFQNATVSLTVDSLNIFNNVPVPGLTPYEYRVGLGGRTGNENENVWIDNIAVGIPEPASIGLSALAFGFLLRRRRH